MKRVAALLMVLFSTNLCAEELTDECLHSMQNVYKFYYYEILPKNKSGSDNLGETEAAQMQSVISALKSNCPAPIIAKMNQFLQEDKA